MLTKGPTGQMFKRVVRAVLRAVGCDLEGTMETLSAPWDRRIPPVANGEAVCPVVAEWSLGAEGVVAVPFDPPLTFPMDLASCWPPTAAVDALVEAARRVRDAEGWLTCRRDRTNAGLSRGSTQSRRRLDLFVEPRLA